MTVKYKECIIGVKYALAGQVPSKDREDLPNWRTKKEIGVNNGSGGVLVVVLEAGVVIIIALAIYLIRKK
ncbi:hypothetical protein PQR63_15300 [Herbaspirillum rhizosphaerae]|uniref:Uncharacterized protein n=1 Tax=Herbaspirillum rhizosphaerae TaxID=346179 RepID=A0ABW8ZC87_9BURK